MRDIVVGMGEVGSAVYALLSKEYEAVGYDWKDEFIPDGPYRVMHICIPYTDEFLRNVEDYRLTFKPKYIFVWSSVPVGTCELMGDGVVHTPVEGKHPSLLQSIKTMVRWIGVKDGGVGRFAAKYFQDLDLRTTVVPSSRYTEFLKLRSTSKYGINIAWTEYEKRVADALGMPFHLVQIFDRDYNNLYKELGLDMFQRYILEPPDGPIGGHCVRPNAEILLKQYPDELLTRILMVGEHHDI